jgi:single-strand DNA-binding protein
MSGINQVCIVGNLGQDPEVRTAANGTVIAKLSVATSDRVKRGEDWVEETQWHRVTVFGKQAENVGKFCKKGRTVGVQGSIRYSKYTDKDGVERHATEIVANSVTFLGGGREGGGDSYERVGPDPVPAPASGKSAADQDIPF